MASRAELWSGRIAAAEKNRETFLKDWQDNVAYRVMQPFPASTDDTVDRVALPEDWSRTKAKTAELAFHLPKIVATAARPEFTAAAPTVTALVNQTLRRMDAHYTVDECLADVINAAGLMAVVVGMDIRTETIPVSAATAVDTSQPVLSPVATGPANMSPIPENPDTSDPGGAPIEGLAPPIAAAPPAEVPVTRRIYQRPTLERISPSDLLWPAEFRLSNWRKARWLGYQTSMTETAVRRKWSDSIPKDWKVESTAVEGTLADDVRETPTQSTKAPTVKVTVVWYYAAEYDEDKVHPECLRTLTFVDGIDEPVDEGDADEQVWVPESPEIPPGPNGEPGSPAMPGHYEGLTRLPILVETLAYVSDVAVPPSDSQVGRSGVRELMRSRSQMIRQRDHSIPVRWYDTNRLDDTVVDGLRAGRWQDMIPVNGPGDRVIGEVARAAYPRENFTFDAVIRQGLDQAWALSNNQLSQPNAETKSATEVAAVQTATSKRSDYEKERVNRFITTIAETVFSLLQRYEAADSYVTIVGDAGAEILQAVQPADLKGVFEFDFVADSSDRLDAATRQANTLKLYNLMANSPTINRRALEADLLVEFGKDPKKLQAPPADPAPEKPNVSYRFSGEDLLNPIALSVLLKTQEITPEDIAAAALVIKDAVAKAQGTDASVVPPTPELGPTPPMGGVPPPVEPPETVAPILKRASDGSRLL